MRDITAAVPSVRQSSEAHDPSHRATNLLPPVEPRMGNANDIYVGTAGRAPTNPELGHNNDTAREALDKKLEETWQRWGLLGIALTLGARIKLSAVKSDSAMVRRIAYRQFRNADEVFYFAALSTQMGEDMQKADKNNPWLVMASVISPKRISAYGAIRQPNDCQDFYNLARLLSAASRPLGGLCCGGELNPREKVLAEAQRIAENLQLDIDGMVRSYQTRFAQSDQEYKEHWQTRMACPRPLSAYDVLDAWGPR